MELEAVVVVQNGLPPDSTVCRVELEADAIVQLPDFAGLADWTVELVADIDVEFLELATPNALTVPFMGDLPPDEPEFGD